MYKIDKILIGTHNKGKFRELSYLLPKRLIKISPFIFDIASPTLSVPVKHFLLVIIKWYKILDQKIVANLRTEIVILII